jgi:hypothetical protein
MRVDQAVARQQIPLCRYGPRLRIDAPARCTVLGDPVMLAQMVRNLVSNALQYNVPGGEVLVELDTGGNLTIGNTGPQISDDEVDRLFEPFYRGAVRTGRTSGAGLGPSIALACNGTATARRRPHRPSATPGAPHHTTTSLTGPSSRNCRYSSCGCWMNLRPKWVTAMTSVSPVRQPNQAGRVSACAW